MTTIIDDKAHAVLGPSGWDRWSICPGSVVLEEGRPNPTSVYAAYGTVAHEIGAQCLIDDVDAEEFVGRTFTVGEEKHLIAVDMEMADAVNDYVAQVRLFVPDNEIRMIEQEVPIGHLTGETGATGTADVVGIVNGGTRLVVIDAKYGKGVQVFASSEESYAPVQGRPGLRFQINGQLGMYALGALERFGMVYDEIVEVELVVIQPRLDHVDSVVVSVEYLREFGEEVRLAAGQVALARQFEPSELMQPPLRLTPGSLNYASYLYPSEKACKFCRAKAICPALQAEVEGSMALLSGPVGASGFEDLTLPKKAAALVPPKDVDNAKLAEAFRAIPLIEEWVSAIGAEVDRRLHDGQKIPGLYLGVGKAGRRAWADPAAAEAELRKRYKVDEMYEKTLISPTRAEKLVKDRPKIWAKIVQTAGIVQPEGKAKVCREGADKNPPYALPSADSFSDLTVSSGLLDD